MLTQHISTSGDDDKTVEQLQAGPHIPLTNPRFSFESTRVSAFVSLPNATSGIFFVLEAGFQIWDELGGVQC